MIDARRFAPVLLPLLAAATAAAAEYYVSPSGDDANAGTSTTSPWRSVARVNRQDLAPGDRVRFQGGQRFPGMLVLGPEDAGSPTAPVVLGSYGSGRAIIAAGDGDALRAANCGGIELRDLVFLGAGATNTGDGVGFWTDAPDAPRTKHLRIDNCDISGFGKTGLYIGDNSNTCSGFEDVRITNTHVHDNDRDGFFTWGTWSASATAPFSHRNFYVGRCRFYGNRGWHDHNSGNGMFLKDVDGAVIEHCVAHGNGVNGGLLKGGGPVGIWVVQCNDILIQHCESYGNRRNGANDGGGFDFDGGVTNSTIQYCYSHDNDGPGVLLLGGSASWARPTSNNVVRYNVSENDGRKSGGAIQLYRDGDGILKDCDVYGNAIYVSKASPTSVAGVRQDGGAPANIRFFNNIIVARDARHLVITRTTSGMSFYGNLYHGPEGFALKWGSTTYGSLSDWRSGSGRETLDGTSTGLQADPLLRAPGTGTIIGDTTQLATLTGYQLQAASPAIDAGVDLVGRFGLAVGGRDFYGDPTPNGAFDIGCHETTKLSSAAAAADIDFQLAGAPTPSGRTADTGGTYGLRNGMSSGWSVSHTDVPRDRDINPDQRLDMLCHFHAGARWELAVVHGDHDVTVTNDTDGQDRFDREAVVEVRDGRLTIAPAAGLANAKVCSVDIVLLPSGGG